VNPQHACPCGGGRPYAACCGPLHQGEAAVTAGALMRSRYTAYVLRLDAYLLSTWHSSTRPSMLELADAADAATRWLGLTVKAHRQQGDTAVVEFIARYRIGGASAQRLHETSRFVREDGRWYYLDGLLQ
jgi:SEC-C motif-containing protein